MKGEKIIKILECLGEGSMEVLDLFVVLAISGSNPSFAGLQYNKEKIERARRELMGKIGNFAQEKHRYHSLICKLKKEGLIENVSTGGSNFLKRTGKGKKKLQILKEKLFSALPDYKREYRAEEGDRLVMVIFDIPETEKRKRNWLRGALCFLGFEKLQKSVWIGKIKLPKDFIKDLSNLKILNCVEILEITKTGSIKNLK